MLQDKLLKADHDLKYQVQHCAIDLHAQNLVEKIKLIRNPGKKLSKYRPKTF